MPPPSLDTFRCLTELEDGSGALFYSLPKAEAAGAGPLSRLPYSLRVLAENLLRHEDGDIVRASCITAFGEWANEGTSSRAVAFFPGRILMQDAAGIPVLADLAALEEAASQGGFDAADALPRLPMDLVVDHAIEVDAWGRSDAAAINLRHEFARHGDRYRFLKWAQERFPSLRVAPPGAGICHQLNLEVFSELVCTQSDRRGPDVAGFDSVLGTDSHTTMANGLSVFGWGIGGIEATAALLGKPVVMRIPDVVGVRLHGELQPGVQATDLALYLTAELRKHQLVQRFVEFCGPALPTLAVPDRATLSNMAPEYGATMAYFPPDAQTLVYLRQTGRSSASLRRVEAFLHAQGMLHHLGQTEPRFTQVIDIDLCKVEATVAGPSLPQQRRTLAQVPATVPAAAQRSPGDGLADGAVVIAAITSCTNTSNPRALVAAGLLARKAVALGLRPAAWTKTSFAPGSRVASELLTTCGLQSALDALGFHVVGHGCTTCMGNSGPLDAALEDQVKRHGVCVAAVISGNRNFEGRIHPAVQLAYLASPALVVAYALAGTVSTDLSRESLGVDRDGRPVCLPDIWPSAAEIDAVLASVDLSALFASNREGWLQGSAAWDAIASPRSAQYPWDGPAGFIRRPPFLDRDVRSPQLLTDISGARPLLILGDGITTDHISPVSRIAHDSAAGKWLAQQGVEARDHGSYSARRLNHDVMLRGGFSNPRLENLMAAGVRGGVTRLMPENELVPVHEAARAYRERDVPVVVVAGARYGAGSARDWAAKVTRLLGVRAVIARSFERIHRSNLVAFGVLPLQLREGDALSLNGDETLDLEGLGEKLRPGATVKLTVRERGMVLTQLVLSCRVETDAEGQWLRAGGVLADVLHQGRLPVATG